MAEIVKRGEFSNRPYRFTISGDEPTVDEQIRIDQVMRDREFSFAKDYEARYGQQITNEGEGVLNYLGEIPKGIARGAVGMFESALLGGAAALPEQYEAPVREGIRSIAYGYKPQADVGMEGTVGGTFGEALGSFGALGLTSLIPGGQFAAPALAVGAGAGEASERARAAGATEGERGTAALLGAPVGALELLPIKFIKVLGRPATGTIVNRLARASAQGGVEGAQEAATTIAQNLIEQGIYNPEQGTFSDTGEALGYGAGVGALVQGLLDLLPGRSRTAAATETPPLDPATLQTQPELPLTPSTRPGFVEGQEQGELFLPTAPAPAAEGSVLPAKAEPALEEEQLSLDLGEVAPPAAVAAPTIKTKPTTVPKATVTAPPEAAVPGANEAAAKAGVPPADSEPGVVDAEPTVPLLTDDLVTELGVRPAKSATLRKMVGRPLTDPKVVKALNSWAQNDKATPENKALAARLITGQPAQEVTDVTPPAKTEPKKVGVGVPSGGQGVEGLGQPAGDAQPAEESAASAERGLGRNMSVPVGTDTAAGAEQPALTEEEQLNLFGALPTTQAPRVPVRSVEQIMRDAEPSAEQQLALDFTPPYDAGTGAARQLIPGTITPVDPRTLQPTGAPRMESSDVYAPTRLIPGAKPTPVGTVLTGAPTEIQLREAEKQLEPSREIREIAANSDAQSELNAAWDARMADKPELASLIAEYSIPDAAVVDDPTTSKDKQKILALLQPGAVRKGKDGSAPAENAQAYFSRFKRPIDALEYIVADATLGNQSFKDSKKLAEEVGTLPAGYETVSPVELEFFTGMTAERAKEALKWVKANLSPQAQAKVRELQRKYKQTQAAKVPNKVTSSLPGSTAVGGRAANTEEKVEFEQELVVQTTEAAAKKAEVKAMAAAARTRVQGLDNLLAAVQETKEPIKPRAVGMRRVGVEPALTKEQLLAKYLSIGEKRQQRSTNLPVTYDRPQDVLDLGSPLHPAVVNQLRNGNLEMALRALQLYAPNNRVKRIVRALAPYAQGTSVRIIKDLKDDSNRTLSGQYRRAFPGKPSEILLDEDTGLSIETLLHEMVHAATISEMRKPASPLRKRMEKLFNDVKPLLSTSNGSSDVMEFMADAMSVPSFQQELATLYPQGGRFSALWQIANDAINLVRRLIGMQPRQLSNALDITDQMVMQMLDFPISMTEISTPEESATILNRVAQVDGSFPGRTKEFAQQFGDDTSRVLDGASYNAKRGILGFLNGQAMADVAGYYKIDGARDLQSAIDQHDAAAIASDSEVDVVLDVAQKWVKNNPNLKPLFDRVVHRSTVNQADPSLPHERALQKYGADSDKMREYDALQKDWAAIGKDGRDLYNNMRQLYRKQYERLRKAIEGKVDFILKDNPELAIEIKKNIYTKFFDLNRIEPYFPLARSGDYWLEYSAFDPETNTTEPVRETYDSPNARTRAIAELDSIPGVVKGPDGKPITATYTTLDLVQQGRTPDALFVRDTLSIIQSNLGKTGVDAATASSIQQEITKLFVDALPETSFAKSLQRRKNTRGYMEDSVEALRVKGYSLGRQGVRYAYSNKIRATASAIAEQAKRTDDQSKIAVIAELMARANFATNPPGDMFERIVQTLNRGAFTFTLGFNVSSALVNLSSVPVVLYPYLAGRYGPKSAALAIGNAYKVFANSGLTREIELPAEFQGKRTATVRAMPSIDNYFVLKEKRTKGADGKEAVTQEYVLRDDVAPELRPMLQELATLVDVASKNGQLNRSIFYDSLGVEGVGRSRNFADKFSAASGAMFHQVERANRQVALVSAYNLELQRLRNKPTAAERGLTEAEQRTRAAERAVYQATETGGGATLAAAPRWSQKGIGRIALMYKNFGLSLFYLQMKLAKQLTLGSNDPDFTPEDRRTAFKQLVGLQLSSFALAGVAGVPLYGLVSTVADAFLGDDEENADMLTRRYLGEGLYKGFLSDISGLDISSRIGLTGLLIRENRYNTDPSAEEVVFQNLGGPAWSTATQFGRGISEFYKAMLGGEGDMVRGIENMVPAAVRNFIKAGRYMSEGGAIETRRKDVITGDLGTSDLLGQALGFTPTKATLEQDLNQLSVRISNAVSEKRSRLSKLYYIALREGDIEGVQEAMEEIRAFNESVAQTFPEAIIDGESLRDSLKGHQRTSDNMVSGVSLNSAVREGLVDLRAQYNRGFQLF